MNTIYIWGIKLNTFSKSEIVQEVCKSIKKQNVKLHLTGVNPETIVTAQSDVLLKKSINDSDIVNIDNMLVVTFLRILGVRVPERAACPDIFETLLAEAAANNQYVYFLGAEPGIIEKMLDSLKQTYPKLKVAGFHHGYYKKEDEKSIIAKINLATPTFLFIGLPTPQKEIFIYQNKSLINAACFFGVGGAFDVKAGKVIRAPLWMRNLGMEGIHRIMQNPRNYGKRVIKYYVPFFKMFIKELIFKKRISKNI